MITAWQIYWVMQLDTIGTVATLLAFAAFMLTVFVWAAYADDAIESPVAPSLLTLPFLAFTTVATFLPSTKTAAAMIVLPAVANAATSETVQREAGELYGIAKDALRELAKSDKPESKE